MSSLAVSSRSFSNHPLLRAEVLKRYPNAKFNDEGLSLKGDALVKFLAGHEKAITALEVIDNEVLAQLPDLRVIGKYGVGLDMIDLKAMKKHDVKLGWTGGVNKRSVSELVVSSAISLLHKTVFASQEVNSGKWYQIRGRQLSDCNVGIVGCGHVGKDLVELLKPFNCKILAHDILDFPGFYHDHGIKPVSLSNLLKESDVVTLHLPLNVSTKRIIGKEQLDLLRNDAVLINFARGGLIDETALLDALKNDRLAGAALDVFEQEPPFNNALIGLKNVLVTPHIGGSTEEAVFAMGMAAIKGLENAKDPLVFL